MILEENSIFIYDLYAYIKMEKSFLCILLLLSSLSVNLLISTDKIQQATGQTTKIANNTTKNNSLLTYENTSSYGIRIQYPSNWQKFEGDGGITFRPQNESQLNLPGTVLVVAVDPQYFLGKNLTLDEAANQEISTLKHSFSTVYGLLRVHLTGSNSSIAGTTGKVIEFVRFAGGKNYNGTDIVFIKQNRVFSIVYAARI